MTGASGSFEGQKVQGDTGRCWEIRGMSGGAQMYQGCREVSGGRGVGRGVGMCWERFGKCPGVPGGLRGLVGVLGVSGRAVRVVIESGVLPDRTTGVYIIKGLLGERGEEEEEGGVRVRGRENRCGPAPCGPC